MKTSAELDQLAAALCEAQFTFPVIPKDRDAKIKTKSGAEYAYKYANLDDVIVAVKPMLHDNGLSVVQGIGIKGGRDVITTRLLHTSGQWIESTMRVPGVSTTEAQSATPQAFGSGITYGKRYAYGSMLSIATDNDDDGTLAQIAFGEDAPRRRQRKPPAGSTDTGGNRGGRVTAPQNVMAATARNDVIVHFKKQDPPITGPALTEKIKDLLGLEELTPIAKLTTEQGIDLMTKIGLLPPSPAPEEAPSDA